MIGSSTGRITKMLVVRVDEQGAEVWQARYDHINAFERLLADRA